MAELITFKVHAKMKGPVGYSLKPGHIYYFEDSPYIRILLKSSSVELIDPPSLDYIDNPDSVVAKKVESETPVVKEDKPAEKLSKKLFEPKKVVEPEAPVVKEEAPAESPVEEPKAEEVKAVAVLPELD